MAARVIAVPGGEIVRGTDGDDTLYGSPYNDLLYGGRGNDLLYGDYGDDTYYYYRGDGRDSIFDTTGWDIVRFGEGILPSDVKALRIGDSVALTLGNGVTDNASSLKPRPSFNYGAPPPIDSRTSDAVVDERYYDENGGIDEYHFADGTVWGREQIDLLLKGFLAENLSIGTSSSDTLVGGADSDGLWGGYGNDTLRADAGDDVLDGGEGDDILYAGTGNDVLLGGSGADRLYGEKGDDVLRGGQGNDYLYDSAGNETYYFARGDGADTILDTQGEDTLIFENIDYTQLLFNRTGPSGRNLEISVANTSDKVTVTDWFLNDSRQIEHIQADGATLEADAVRGLVDALANYASPPADSAPGVSLVNLIGSYWDVEAVGTIEWT